jgi:hypothetical protein
MHLRISNLSTFAVLISRTAICYNKTGFILSIDKSFKRDQRSQSSEGREDAVENAVAKSRWVASATSVASIEGCGGEIILSYIGSLYR